MKMTQMLDPPSPRLTHLITRIGDSRRRRGGAFSCIASVQWRINHDANDAMAWGPPLKGAPRAAV